MKYVIRKIASDLLFYVDRSKTKSMWWSYKPSYALLYTSKEEAQNKANSLKFGRFEVITEVEMKQLRQSKDLKHSLKKYDRWQYNEHPFSCEGHGQWDD